MRRVFVGLVRSWRGLLHLCVLLPSLAMCQTVAGFPSTNSNTYALNGTVVNSVTGEPIRRALVRLQINGEHLAFSDSSGRFELDNLPAGQAMAFAQKPGYFAEQELERHPATPMSVVIGPDSPALTLKLVPQSVISGHIKTAKADPIEGAHRSK